MTLPGVTKQGLTKNVLNQKLKPAHCLYGIKRISYWKVLARAYFHKTALGYEPRIFSMTDCSSNSLNTPATKSSF